MKSVSEQEWKKKAEGLAEWRKNRTSPPNLDLYKRIVSMVYVGESCLDVGAGQCHLKKCLSYKTTYSAIDPYPLSEYVQECTAENLVNGFMLYGKMGVDTVFMLAALDNVIDLKQSLLGLKTVAKENIVILTSIGVPPDKNHTVQVDREDLVSVLGEPFQEVEMLPKVWLYEWRVK